MSKPIVRCVSSDMAIKYSAQFNQILQNESRELTFAQIFDRVNLLNEEGVVICDFTNLETVVSYHKGYFNAHDSEITFNQRIEANGEAQESGFDPVSSPSHYCDGRKYEPRKVIRDWGLNFNLGNAVKYLSRAGRKEGSSFEEDLKKAKQYIEFELEAITENNEEGE